MAGCSFSAPQEVVTVQRKCFQASVWVNNSLEALLELLNSFADDSYNATMAI